MHDPPPKGRLLLHTLIVYYDTCINEYAVFYLLLMRMCLSYTMLTVQCYMSGFDTCCQIESPGFYVNHTVTTPWFVDILLHIYGARRIQ